MKMPPLSVNGKARARVDEVPYTEAPDILVIITGGTIDAEAYTGEPPENIKSLESSLVPYALGEMGLAERCSFLPWKMRDSKHFSRRKDLPDLADIIRTAKERYIIITHGTDRMAENSRIIKKLLGDTDKTVIFTGAMVPLACGDTSDGHANMRYAVRNMHEFGSGVHIVMHEERFDPDKTRKNFKTMRFEKMQSIENTVHVGR